MAPTFAMEGPAGGGNLALMEWQVSIRYYDVDDDCLILSSLGFHRERCLFTRPSPDFIGIRGQNWIIPA